MSCTYNYHRVCLIHSPYRLYNKMAMEVILSTAFGRAIDVQGGKGGQLFEAALTVFGGFAPPKEDEPLNVFRILQFVLCKFLYSPFHL